MTKIRTAKIFRNGSSQAVRLPAEFRFNGNEVFITRDRITGDVVLSAHPGKATWGDFFALLRELEETPEFIAERPMNRPPRRSGVFDDSIRSEPKAR